jgi:hypothetical protein
MGNSVYIWKRNFFNADAQKVGEELEKIEVRNAETVLEAAKKKKSELHKCFEWDDPTAAEEYRKEQARLVMRMIAVEVRYEDTKGEPEMVMVRAFESVQPEDKDAQMVYVPTMEALSDHDMRMQIRGRLISTITEAQKTAKIYGFMEASSYLEEAKKSLSK